MTAADDSPARLAAVLAWWRRVTVGVVLAAAVANCIGWATGMDRLTRVFASWPQMTPWTAVLVAGLGVAILAQSGRPSPVRVGVGCGLAVVVGVLAGAFLAEYATGRSFGLDQLWFPEAIQTMSSWPGRPSGQTLLSVLLLSLAVGVTRLDRRWTTWVWVVGLLAATAPPFVILAGHVYEAVSLMGVTRSTGMGISTAISVVMLVTATFSVRPDRNPLAWLLARPDRWTLVRLVAILAGLPLLIGLSRPVFLIFGFPEDAALVLSLSAGIVVVGAAAFYLSQREQKLLIEKESLTRQRAEAGRKRASAEAWYSLLADNAVDIVAHIRGTEVVWISPSVEAAFGDPPEQWIGKDIRPRIHTDDLDAVTTELQAVVRGRSVVVRCRVYTADGDFRWIEARGKPYSDAVGHNDGLIFAASIVEEQVRAQQQLHTEKERFESVVGKAPSAISVRDLQHRYTMVNEAFCRMYGQDSVESVVGRTEADILPADVLHRSRLAAVRVLAGEDCLEEESIHRGPEHISVMTQRFPLHNAAGAITELVTIRTDITHRKKIEDEAADRELWETRIKHAIASGRLLAYSQPIVDIATRTTVAEELLVRLRADETDEIISPAQFLPQCEQHGLMPTIDRYMVGRAIELARMGRHVSVNITGQTIEDATTLGEILEALANAGPDVADKIIFEITETTAIASPAMAKAFSVSMRDRGCRVALDDFGTGYGTFNELRHLALHALKIDLSFVRNMLEDHDDERVVKMIVVVARAYGLATVAEGVESEAVLEKLAELGADRAQGFLFGKPKPIDTSSMGIPA